MLFALAFVELVFPFDPPNVSRSPASRAHRCSCEILPQVLKPPLMTLATCPSVDSCLEGADRLVQRGVIRRPAEHDRRQPVGPRPALTEAVRGARAPMPTMAWWSPRAANVAHTRPTRRSLAVPLTSA